MTELTPDDVRASIVPKSDQLNADDLLTGPMTVTITGVKQGDREQPIVVELDGQRPYKPCKTMRRVLIAVYGDTPKNWVGQRLTLFNDQSVMWAGVKVGGIRISHMSGLDEPKTFLLTMTRGKKTEVTIQPAAGVARARQTTTKASLHKDWAPGIDALKGKSWDAGMALAKAMDTDGDLEPITKHIDKLTTDGEIDTRSKQTLDRFADAIRRLRNEAN